MGTLAFLLFLFAALVFLPFKIVGGILRLAFGVVGGVLKVGFALAGVVFGLVVAAFVLVLLPLFPLLLLGGLVWLVARLLRPRTSIQVIP